MSGLCAKGGVLSNPISIDEYSDSFEGEYDEKIYSEDSYDDLTKDVMRLEGGENVNDEVPLDDDAREEQIVTETEELVKETPNLELVEAADGSALLSDSLLTASEVIIPVPNNTQTEETLLTFDDPDENPDGIKDGEDEANESVTSASRVIDDDFIDGEEDEDDLMVAEVFNVVGDDSERAADNEVYLQDGEPLKRELEAVSTGNLHSSHNR